MMRKIISLFLVMALFLSMGVAFATEGEISYIKIVTVSDGQVFQQGDNILLMAESNVTGIQRVDFYANGDKIPGCVTSVSETMFWYNVLCGSYEITAVLTTQSGGTVTGTPVQITVKDETKTAVSFQQAEDILTWKGGRWGETSLTLDKADQTHTKISNSSLKHSGLSTNNQILNLKNVTIDRTGYDYFNIWLYSDTITNITMRVQLQGLSSYGSYFEVNWTGWKLISIPFGSGGFNAAAVSAVTQIEFTTYGYKIPTGFTNSGAWLHEQPTDKLAATALYLDSIWFSKTAPALTNGLISTAQAKSSIPNGQINVCNEMSKVRFTFDKAMLGKTFHSSTVKLTDVTNQTQILSGITYAVGNGYVDVHFEAGILAYNTNYQIELTDGILDKNGAAYAGSTWMFKTIENNCANAVPIPAVTYPVSGATIGATAKLAAKVIFDANVNSVEFYKSDNTLIGQAVKQTGNEYLYYWNGVAAGSYSVYAKVNYSGTSVSSTPISLTVGTTSTYAVLGIRDGYKYVINGKDASAFATDIRVIDAAQYNKQHRAITPPVPTNVSKVYYLVDDATVAAVSTPFSWSLPFADTKSHNLKVIVIDTLGNAQSFGPYTYQALYAVNSASSLNGDLEKSAGTMLVTTGENKDIFTDIAFNTTYNKDSAMYSAAPDRTGTAINLHSEKLGATGGVSKYGISNISIPSSKLIKVEFDFRTDSNNASITLGIRNTFDNYTLTDVNLLYSYGSVWSLNKWHKASITIDFANKKTATYIDGIEYMSSTLKTDYSGKGHLTDNLTAFCMQFLITPGSNLATNLYFDNFNIRVLNNYKNLFVDSLNSTMGATTADTNVLVANTKDVDDGFTLIHAVYSANRELITISKEDVSIGANTIYTKSSNVSLTYGEKTGSVVKVFCWDDAESSLKPLIRLR